MINKKNILFISLFISILLAAIISFYLYNSTYPLELELKHEKQSNMYGTKYMVHDYDKDGRGEWFDVTTREYEKRATIIFRMNKDVLYDEFSVRGRTDIRWLRFDDLNGDNKDELIMFSVYRDSVYLSIINLHTLQFIKKEKFLIAREAESDQFWDVVCYYIGRIENELFFFVSSGYSHKPRLFLSYSIEEERVNNNFYVASPFRDHYIADVNNDGKDEIVSIGGGTGNRPNENFTDMTSWIFILNNELEFLVSPINIGHYPNAGVRSNLLKKGKKHSILISQNVNTATGEKSKVILFDDSLRKIKRLEFTANSMNLTTIEMDGESCGVITTDNGQLQLFNSKLDVFKSRIIERDYPVTIISSDFNYDGSTEIILISETQIRIFNNDLGQLSEFELSEIPISIENYITINQSYKNDEAGIALNMPSGFKYYAITENLDYVLLPVYVVLIFAGLFMFIYLYLGGYNQYQLYLKRRQLIRADHAFALFAINGELIERSTKFRLTANVNSLKELLQIVGTNSNVANYVRELGGEKISRVHTLNRNELRIILVKDERTFHEPVIYAFITEKKSTNSSERELWSKSIQKIAHDIKTPISSLLLNLKAIGLRLDKVEFSGKEDFVADIEAMKEELSRVNNLTRGFLRFTNIEEPKFKITNLFELIQNVSETFSHYTNNGIEIDVDIDKEIYVNADDYQLREVFQALLENAIEAMHHNGTINISAEEIDGMHDSVSSEIMVSVSDHGEGMCPEIIGKIFETTFTSKITGNGLGLPIAKRIIELHRGRIEVYSREGIGTTFKIFLPSNR